MNPSSVSYSHTSTQLSISGPQAQDHPRSRTTRAACPCGWPPAGRIARRCSVLGCSFGDRSGGF